MLSFRSRASNAFFAASGVLFAALAFPTIVPAEPSLFDEYSLTSWTDEDGLFGGWIVGIAQDEHGYLWVGSVSGLLRFDGLRFERFHDSDGTQLPQRSVSSVYAARDGSVWVGFSGEGGVGRIHDGQVRNYETTDGLGRGRVAALAEDVDGAMLAATPEGLFRLPAVARSAKAGFAADRWERIGAAHGLPDGLASTAYRDRAGALWVVTANALYRRESPRAGFQAISKLVDAPSSLSESAQGTLWMSDPAIGYRMLAAPSQDAQARKRGRVGSRPSGVGSPESGALPSRQGYGYRLLHDRAGNLWVATLGQGLWFVPNGDTTPQLVSTDNGLSADTVRCLFEDGNGDIWVGTTTGLHRFARRRVTPITDLGVVRAVVAGPRGDVWIATAEGLVRFSQRGRRRYRASDGLPSVDVRALHIDPSGRLWLATTAGVAVFANDRISALPLAEGAWPSVVSAIATDGRGTVWLATQDEGLFRWRDGRLSPAKPSDTIDGLAVHSVAADRHGGVWAMLAGGGLGLIDPGGAFRLLREGDRVHRSDLAVYADDNGTVWFGAGERLTRVKSGKLSTITRSNGLPAETIRAIAGDRAGNLWIGTSGGIIRLAESEFDKAIAESLEHLDFRSYNASDGLAGVPVRVGSPSAARGTDGRLWFVTGNGVTIVDPKRLSTPRPAPRVRIERVTANGRSFDVTGPFELPPRTPSLQIEYTALELFSPRQVEFHYRLEGLDDGWTEARSRREVSFTNLPPRRYRFHVIARSSEGIWNEQGDALEFSILPTFYQTNWFYGMCALSICALVVLGWRLRLRHVRHEFALVLTERARMAREIHDTLLQSLAGLELQVDAMSGQLDASQGPLKRLLDRVRRQIQRDVSEARQSIWDLRSPTLESRDLASALRELGETAVDATGVELRFTLTGQPSRCAKKVEEHLLRVGREAISNAVRHAQARLVHVELHYGGDSITLRVSDDGRGFDVTEATRQSGHWGLAAMHERAQAIGGHLELVSQPGAGTNLEMVAPLLPSSSS